jgi:hypothetical protein
MFVGKSWRHSDPAASWFPAAQRLVAGWGCRLRVDPRWHWRESVYIADFQDRGPCILVGGSGRSAYVCTALLHELGHHVVAVRGQTRADIVANEEAAWRVAIALAAEHRLPLVATLRRQALYSYRYALLHAETQGSKHNSRRRKRTTVDRLHASAKTSRAKRTDQFRPLGKKGKRKYKKEVKSRTARYERRNARTDED